MTRVWRSPENVTAPDLNALEAAIGASEAGLAQAAGDLFVGTGPGALTRLPIGSSGQALTVVSGAPAWAPAPQPDPTEDLALPRWWAPTEAYR
jgi:hypothetical protein